MYFSLTHQTPQEGKEERGVWWPCILRVVLVDCNSYKKRHGQPQKSHGRPYTCTTSMALLSNKFKILNLIGRTQFSDARMTHCTHGHPCHQIPLSSFASWGVWCTRLHIFRGTVHCYRMQIRCIHICAARRVCALCGICTCRGIYVKDQLKLIACKLPCWLESCGLGWDWVRTRGFLGAGFGCSVDMFSWLQALGTATAKVGDYWSIFLEIPLIRMPGYVIPRPSTHAQ